MALRLPPALTAERVARRVDEQFARGIVAEVEGLLARGVPPDARPFGGLVYRQVMEMLRGVRDEPATRALIVQENRRYARRQLIWFRKEPNLIWFDGPGEQPATQQRVRDALAARLRAWRSGEASGGDAILMAQVTEPRSSSPSSGSAQHPGRLPELRAARSAGGHHSPDGRPELRGAHQELRQVRRDRRGRRRDQLIFKHAISTIETPRAVANYFSQQS